MIKLSEPLYVIAEKKLPEKWRLIINNYSISAEKITEESEWRILVKSTITNTIIYSVIIITIILFNVKYIQPYFWEYQWSRIITASITLILISPFVWALSFRKPKRVTLSKILTDKVYRNPLAILQITKIGISLFYIGFMFDTLFSHQIALLGVAISVVLLYVFSKHIMFFYGKIEDRFLSNYHERENKQKANSQNLTPWDTHLSTFKLNAKIPFIGKTLLESKIREDFGVNIASIEREDLIINVPDRYERLFPNDIISVIGTDEQLRKFKDSIEKKDDVGDLLKTKSEIKLLHFTVNPNSTIENITIKDSNIRELTKGLVVGIERNGKRILNPESNEVFKQGDIVWIVGNEKRIQVMAGQQKK
jgi:CPA2 family monovalent cation:H+ antiporter-2